MLLDSISPALPSATSLLERLSGRLDSVTAALDDLSNTKFPSLQKTVDGLRELLVGRHKDHYRVDEIAEMTGRSAYTVRRWIAEGKLQAIRLQDGGPRGRLLVPRAELERLIASGHGSNIPETVLG